LAIIEQLKIERIEQVHIAKLIVLIPLIYATSALGLDRVECRVIETKIEKLVCTYETTRVDFDRSVTFLWHSLEHPQDDRERTITLKASHGSVYDYRFLRGRAQGSWEVSVRVDGSYEPSALHEFTLQDTNLQNTEL